MSHSSTSPSKVTCGFCHRGTEVESSCGQLYTDPECSAHKKCMQYSALLVQYRTKGFGGFKKHRVIDEIKRGRGLRCYVCKRKNGKKQKAPRGATCGCAIGRCPKTFHYYCAHRDDKIICRRIEVRNKFTDRASVLYRIFCSPEHQAMFEKTSAKEMEISYNSESSATDYSSGEDESIHFPKSLKKSKLPKVTTDVASDNKESEDDLTSDSSDAYGCNKKRSSASPQELSNKRSRSELCEKTLSANAETTLVSMPSATAKGTDSESGDAESAPESEQIADVLVMKSEPLSPPTMKTSSKPGSDVILCIMEEGQHLKEYGSRIRQMISKHFNINQSSIHFWSNQGPHQVSLEHMLLFMRDVAKAVYQSNTDALLRLISKPISSDLETYSAHIRYMEDYMDENLHALIQTRIRDVIGDYLIEKSKQSGVDAGGAFFLAELNSIFIALPLNDQLDPGNRIRRQLAGRELIYPVAFGMDLTSVKQGDVILTKESTENLDMEMTALSLWLQNDVDEPLKIRVRPKEVILRQSTTMSNTCQLCNYFQRRNSAEELAPASIVMFIVPVQGEIIAYGAYCRAAISAFVQEELTALSPVYCILDINEREGFSRIEDILPSLPSNISACAFSGLDPAVYSVSCLILKFYINV